MSLWAAGTWADVAIGDDVLGSDGYVWRVTAGLINRFGFNGNGANLRITMEREPVGARTGDIPASKPVKYSAGESRGIVVSCYACHTAGQPCDSHVSKAPDVAERLPERAASDLPVAESSDQSPVRDPSPVLNSVSTCEEVNGKATAKRLNDAPSPSGTGEADGTDPSCLGCALDAHRCSGCAGPARHGEAVCRTCAGTGDAEPATSIPEVARETSDLVTEFSSEPPATQAPADPPMCYGDGPEPHPLGASGCVLADVEPAESTPYVEWTPEERAAATALKAAGIEAKVIERVMTLSELTSHLQDAHGVELPARGPLIGVEYRSRLADLHFDRHAHEQHAGEQWKPRGRTPHTHPVMDRPMHLKR